MRLLTVIVFVVSFLSSQAFAGSGPPFFGVSGGMVWSVRLPSGESFTPRTGLGLSVLAPMGDLAFIGDLGFSSSTEQFDPFPTLILGVSGRVRDRFFFGGSMAYVYMPPYRRPDGHLIGASAVPAFKISDNVMVIMPTGLTYIVIGGDLAFTMSFKVVLMAK